MGKLIALTLGILLATLTLSGIGQAQEATTIHGTIQGVDCKTNVLLVKADDGTQYNIRVSPAGSSSAVFVNSTPVGFCTLQQYIGSNVTVSLVSNGDQLIVKRVDVNNAAAVPASGPSQTAGPLTTGMPKWAEIALGVIIVGALVYIGSQRHDPPAQNQPYYQCRDGSWRQSCP